jgi:hypothetical protein
VRSSVEVSSAEAGIRSLAAGLYGTDYFASPSVLRSEMDKDVEGTLRNAKPVSSITIKA